LFGNGEITRVIALKIGGIWMNINKWLKRFFIGFLLACLCSILSACQGNNEEFTIVVFSNLPQESILKGDNVLDSYQVEEKDVKINLYPPMLERLVMEIVNHSGDIIIIEKEMLSTVLDPIGLNPLDEIKSKDSLTDIIDLQATDEEGNTKLYAVPIPSEHPIFQELPVTAELVAIIPRYTNHKEQALTLLKALVNGYEEE
jgi:hypothetical protein